MQHLSVGDLKRHYSKTLQKIASSREGRSCELMLRLSIAESQFGRHFRGKTDYHARQALLCSVVDPIDVKSSWAVAQPEAFLSVPFDHPR